MGLHRGGKPPQVPSGWQINKGGPITLNPGLHMNIQLDPTGEPSTQDPILYPLSGASRAEQVLITPTEFLTHTGG